MTTPAASVPPDPRSAATIGALVAELRRTRTGAGAPSVRILTRRVNALRSERVGSALKESVPPTVSSTVGYCFNLKRKQLDYDLLFDLLRSMQVSDECLEWWREAWQSATASRDDTVAVDVDRVLPPDPPHFSGRLLELNKIMSMASDATVGDVVFVFSVDGMAWWCTPHMRSFALAGSVICRCTWT